MQLTTPAAAPPTFCPVFSGTIGASDPQPVCDARDLHGALQVRRDFSNWLKGRIAEFGFVEGEDFSPVLAKTPPENGRPRTDYLLALDMAKELSMVENNDVGRAMRRYFIACEKRQSQAPAQLTAETVAAVIRALQSSEAKDAGLRLIVKKQNSASNAKCLRKFSREQVLEIIDSPESHLAIAKRMACDRKLIARIRGGQTYRDITGFEPRTRY